MRKEQRRPNRKTKQQFRVGQKFGEWELKKKLGHGGNGDVWMVLKNGSQEDHAIKLLRSIDAISYERFKAEITALSELDGITGIIPLVDKFIPERITGPIPWFVMPIAKTFNEYARGIEPKRIVEDFFELSKALSALHSRCISHRDIKPANILYYNDKLCLSDFGLVKYPNRTDITPKRQDVGPKFTMAPEMRRNASEADGLAADVYSFSKTLWIALTNEIRGFDGQYSSLSVLGLKNYLPKDYTTTLDQLITECTDNDPKRRPLIGQVTSRLKEWLSLVDDFHKRNLTEWVEVQQILFPTGAPERAVWTEIDSICAVLHEIAKVPSLNHMFYPSSGGNTIIGVSRATEQGMIALHVSEKTAEILKPSKLTFESFGRDADWNYFRLEVEPIEPTGIQEVLDIDGISEPLTEIKPGNYINYRHWDNNEYMGEPLPETARSVSRFLKGCFVFFSTRSTYNRTPSTYDGRHNKMSEDDFRQYIEKNAKYHKS